MTPAIRVENLGKRYRISHEGKSHGSYRTMRDTVMDLAKAPLRPFRRNAGASPTKGAEDFWALKDISFEVQPGEVVGIIGRNGAGKSTLLKILSRITKPTIGQVTLNGRVGSLLEVGTGFHPELTGRENIFLNGSILGMKKAEIQKQFDAIIDFSGIEQFLDTPVKRYSSGMYVRLAFAVAAHLEPEILIVDEVLAVGDTEFQRKCLGKMDEVAHQGRTVMFVSHNMAAIAQLCHSAICLNNGKLTTFSGAAYVVEAYLKAGLTTNNTWTHVRRSHCGKEVNLQTLRILDSAHTSTSVVGFDSKFTIAIDYNVGSQVPALAILIRLSDSKGNVVFTSWDTDGATGDSSPRRHGDYRSVCVMPVRFLRPGWYTVSVGVRAHGIGLIDYHDNVAAFEVSASGFPMNLDRMGIIAPVLRWEVLPL